MKHTQWITLAIRIKGIHHPITIKKVSVRVSGKKNIQNKQKTTKKFLMHHSKPEVKKQLYNTCTFFSFLSVCEMNIYGLKNSPKKLKHPHTESAFLLV